MYVKNLTPLVENLEENHKNIHDDNDELSADKGYDSAENNTALYDDHGIKPVIDNRMLWKTQKYETLFPDRYMDVGSSGRRNIPYFPPHRRFS